LLQPPTSKQKLANIGFAQFGDTPAEFTAFLKGKTKSGAR